MKRKRNSTNQRKDIFAATYKEITKMKLKIFLHVLLCLTLNGKEIYAGLGSSHFNNFGCIVRTNVTIFYPNTAGSLFTMVKYLEDPCITSSTKMNTKRISDCTNQIYHVWQTRQFMFSIYTIHSI